MQGKYAFIVGHIIFFGIDLNIPYSTKFLDSDNSRMYKVLKSLYIFLIPEV